MELIPPLALLASALTMLAGAVRHRAGWLLAGAPALAFVGLLDIRATAVADSGLAAASVSAVGLGIGSLALWVHAARLSVRQWFALWPTLAFLLVTILPVPSWAERAGLQSVLIVAIAAASMLDLLRALPAAGPNRDATMRLDVPRARTAVLFAAVVAAGSVAIGHRPMSPGPFIADFLLASGLVGTGLIALWATPELAARPSTPPWERTWLLCGVHLAAGAGAAAFVLVAANVVSPFELTPAQRLGAWAVASATLVALGVPRLLEVGSRVAPLVLFVACAACVPFLAVESTWSRAVGLVALVCSCSVIADPGAVVRHLGGPHPRWGTRRISGLLTWLWGRQADTGMRADGDVDFERRSMEQLERYRDPETSPLIDLLASRSHDRMRGASPVDHDDPSDPRVRVRDASIRDAEVHAFAGSPDWWRRGMYTASPAWTVLTVGLSIRTLLTIAEDADSADVRVEAHRRLSGIQRRRTRATRHFLDLLGLAVERGGEDPSLREQLEQAQADLARRAGVRLR